MTDTPAPVREVNDKTRENWQGKINALAEKYNVPCAAITRLRLPKIENFILNQSEDNPAKAGHIGRITGSYCGHVIDTNETLHVPDALSDPDWDQNPDVKINLIAYLGLPLLNPDGTPFGTICILDDRENQFDGDQEETLRQMKAEFEADLAE